MIKGVKGKLGTVGYLWGKNPQNVSNFEIHTQLVYSRGFDSKSKQNSNNIYI